MTHSASRDDDFGVFGRALEAYMWLYGNRLVAVASWPVFYILVWGLLQFVRMTLLLCCFLASYALACLWFLLPTVARWPLIGGLAYVLTSIALEREWYFLLLFGVHVLLKILATLAGDVRAREANLLLAPIKGFVFATACTYPYAQSWVLRIAAITIAIPIVNRIFVHCLEGWALRELIVAQGRRDRRAWNIANRVQRGDKVRPFVLYLRPFSLTAQQVAVSYFDAVTRDDNGPRIEEIRDEAGNLTGRREYGPGCSVGLHDAVSTHESNADVETEWERAVSKTGLFVGLGRSREALGAGRIETDDEHWRNVFQPLASAAALCIVIPSANPGTQWEVRWLASQGLLEKCCFYMPPQTASFDFSAQWMEAKSALADVVQLPDFNPGGMLVHIGATDSRQYPLDCGGAIPKARILRDALRSCAPTPFSSAVAA